MYIFTAQLINKKYMKFKILSLIFCFSTVLSLAQDKVKYSKEDIKKMEMYLFNEGFSGPSPKKISTVVLKDGAIHKGYCKEIDTKKGQIYAVSLKDSVMGSDGFTFYDDIGYTPKEVSINITVEGKIKVKYK